MDSATQSTGPRVVGGETEMTYYIETLIGSPTLGTRRVVGGQGPDGRPLVTYATPEAAAADVARVKRDRWSHTADAPVSKDVPLMSVNVRRIDDLRIPGRDGYMRLWA